MGEAVTGLDDLRRRAAQQSQVGNYWAGKCLGLIDRARELDRERDALRRLVADAYRHHPSSLAWCEVTGEMDAALQRALDACDPEPPDPQETP